MPQLKTTQKGEVEEKMNVPYKTSNRRFLPFAASAPKPKTFGEQRLADAENLMLNPAFKNKRLKSFYLRKEYIGIAWDKGCLVDWMNLIHTPTGLTVSIFGDHNLNDAHARLLDMILSYYKFDEDWIEDCNCE